MHHKRKRAKNQRSGCLLCKPNKANGAVSHELGHTGFGKLRDLQSTAQDLKAELYDWPSDQGDEVDSS